MFFNVLSVYILHKLLFVSLSLSLSLLIPLFFISFFHGIEIFLVYQILRNSLLCIASEYFASILIFLQPFFDLRKCSEEFYCNFLKLVDIWWFFTYFFPFPCYYWSSINCLSIHSNIQRPKKWIQHSWICL